MQLSNDVKWNKIRLIMNELGAYCNEQWREYLLDYDFEIAAKFAHRDTWILANKLYDIAVDGLDEDCHEYDYSITPYHWKVIVNNVLNISSFITTDTWKLYARNSYWEEYDYNNS